MISRRDLIIVIVYMLSMYGVSTWQYSNGAVDADKIWQARWSNRDAADSEERAARESAMRDLERARQNEMDQVTEDAKNRLEQAQADAAASSVASISLQQQLKTLRSQLAAGGSCQISGSSGTGQTAAVADVLANVLSEADSIAGAMAEEADRARIAGMACERMYVGITDGSH